jgi:hypothetical protein
MPTKALQWLSPSKGGEMRFCLSEEILGNGVALCRSFLLRCDRQTARLTAAEIRKIHKAAPADGPQARWGSVCAGHMGYEMGNIQQACDYLAAALSLSPGNWT